MFVQHHTAERGRGGGLASLEPPLTHESAARQLTVIGHCCRAALSARPSTCLSSNTASEHRATNCGAAGSVRGGSYSFNWGQ